MTKATAEQISRVRPFIERLERVFGRHQNGSQFYGELALALGGFTTDALDRGADELLRVHERFWPSPAECRKFVDAARSDLVQSGREYRNEIPDGYRVTDEQAKRMLLCEEGYAAALEGYHVRIFDHIREHGKFPDQRALRQIITDFRSATFVNAKGREVSRSALWTEQPGELKAITVFRNAALARRKQLKEYILEHYQSAASAG